MTYKTEIIPYSPKAKTLAKRIEKKANEIAKQWYKLTSCTVTLGAKAILVFEKIS